MPLTVKPLPFGLRDVKLWLLDNTGTRSGTGVDLPASRVFSFKDTQEFSELDGDDVRVAVHGGIRTTEWSLENGGISLEAYVIMAGGTVTTTGTTPNQIKKYTVKNTDDRPYFDVEGQAISDSGGDFHKVVYRCKADGDLEGELKTNEFWITKASGTGYGKVSDGTLYDDVQNETTTAITP